MTQEALLTVVRALLEQPTAPFQEQHVRAEIVRLLAHLPHIFLEQDAVGNLVATYQRGEARPQFAFAAHMDHPAYVGGEFLGSVPQSYLEKQAPTRDFGSFAMWDLPAFELREDRIHSRACDDLIGCAAIVCMLQELEATGAEASCLGLFTRAEEVGFVGALQLALAKVIPQETVIISLETSSERGGPVRMGEGVIIRVGDLTSIFDSGATATLVQLARQEGIPYQRALMSGGVCEATAYQLYGYRAAGLCVALGNYHNCAPGELIAPEFVSWQDVQGLVKLCVAAASAGALPDPTATLRTRLEDGLRKYQQYL